MRTRRAKRKALAKPCDSACAQERSAEDDAYLGVQLHGAHVLVVDDSAVNLELARYMLLRAGVAVTLAHNGAEAVELLRTSPSAYDAVFMDVHMPVLDGLEATRCIRNTLHLTALPIVAITAGDLLSERQQAIDAGMNDSITKPFDTRTAVDALCRQLSRAVMPVHSAPLTTATSAPPGWPVVVGMDATDTFVRFGGDQRLFAKLLQHLFDELEALPSAAESCSMLAARLHKLSGSAAMLGAETLRSASNEAERIARVDPAQGLRVTALSVVPQLRRLRESAAPLMALMATQPRCAAPSPADSKITHFQLEELIDLLTRHRIDALDVFAGAAHLLQSQLGNQVFAELDRAMNSLRYERALQILQVLIVAPSEA